VQNKKQGKTELSNCEITV